MKGLVTLMTLLLSLCSCSQSHRLSALPQDALIVAFGDSLTAGTGVQPGQSYPAQLSSTLGRQVINAGIPGELSSEGLLRLPGVLDEYQPDLVILIHGGNDILQRKDQAITKENIRAMIKLIQRNQSQVVLLAVPELSLWGSTPELYQELADEYDLAINRNIISRLERDRSKKSDAVHFNTQGYADMASAVFELLQENGAVP